MKQQSINLQNHLSEDAAHVQKNRSNAEFVFINI
jgi:hypothetical protein